MSAESALASRASSLCQIVGEGGVGESGSTLLLTYQVTNSSGKLMVLRNIDSSLCPNQGVVGVIAINGHPEVTGNLGSVGSSIQVFAPAGAKVVACAHMIPLFNNITCVRLGNCSLQLDACDLETVPDRSIPNTRNWFAWNDIQPPPPDSFHLVGEVEVIGPLSDVLLVERSPQGINPRILLLDLVISEPTGSHSPRRLFKPVSFARINRTYDSAQIFFEDDVLINVDATPVS